MIHLILGGARSGKSKYALELVKKTEASNASPVTVVATATSIDDEMADRIRRHKSERPKHWQLAEVPLNLTHFIQKIHADTSSVLLIDCLTLWLNNQLFTKPEQDFKQLFKHFIHELVISPHHIIIVSNEVGLGVIPMGEISRQFVDQAGWLNQAVADAADEVTFVAAGLPMTLKAKSSKGDN
ncbi:bifunctional adenosylcobinamide kinase/adenosylcobinamide-phosphate guanylyltransferase [Paraglaciecola sp.]|uniref:bifunctional adenosylcobinamide kinase/adenosylcobinamide-phosphate guanylyltransferase n=1 Tax=Paraglaciecola sp. TaxID=1920173 RepID=UPI003EF2BF5F